MSVFHGFPIRFQLSNIRVMRRLQASLCCLLLVLAGSNSHAALSGSERKAYESAGQAFQLKLWTRAEKEFADFVRDFPNSENFAKAMLLQAQAQFEQRKYGDLVELLRANFGRAGDAADQFLYWIGQAQLKSGDLVVAGQTFGRLAREYPASPFRLEAAVNEAAALAKQGQWTNVQSLLRQSDGPFRLAATQAQGSELVSRGFLLLAEAQLTLGDYPGAEVSLNRVNKDLTADLEWQRRYLLCRVLAASGRADQAAEESDGMIKAAQGAVQFGLLADSVVFRAELLEQLGRWADALATWQLNFTNAPVARQRQALSRATALAIRQNQLIEATRVLDLYLQLNQYTNAPADVAWLTLGELRLKQAVLAKTNLASGVLATNDLAAAEDCFQRVVKGFPGSTYIGKAQLGLGWCFWVQDKFAESETAFDAAAKRLPPSEDKAVALFKLADTQFVLSNYLAALENYRQVLDLVTNESAADKTLSVPASYQALRASLALTNIAGAEASMRRILEANGASNEAVGSLLLVSQAYVDARQPEMAGQLFAEFAARFPDSSLRPEVELLVARMMEQQGMWNKAEESYDIWLTTYPTNQLRPQVEFQRALAAAGAGNELAALRRLTNFVADYPEQPLAPQAQWWVADYYFNQGDYVVAELNYKLLFQTWPGSPLAYQARLMAGRSAMAVGSSKYPAAIEHFTSLTSDTNCPPELWMQAMSAYAAALMRSPPAATETNKMANLETALRVLKTLTQSPATNALLAAAFGEYAGCALQLGDYSTASNAYRHAIAYPGNSVTVRSQAKVGLAIVLEKMAQRSTNGVQLDLLAKAREEDLDVYLGSILREGEVPDSFWRKKSGLEAARLSELLQDWPQALEMYRDMLRQNLLPREELQQKIENVERSQRAQMATEEAAKS